jgi:hypothetical protein
MYSFHDTVDSVDTVQKSKRFCGVLCRMTVLTLYDTVSAKPHGGIERITKPLNLVTDGHSEMPPPPPFFSEWLIRFRKPLRKFF